MESNFHTHTRFCDGRDQREELVKRALDLGFSVLGFSGHSDTGFDPCGMRDGDGYRREIARLREKYSGRIEIYCGIEQDYFSGCRREVWDYAIGSVHYVRRNGKNLPVDWSEDETARIIGEEYGGDAMGFAEDYFRLVSEVDRVTGCDIVGHFDLITKFDEDGRVFSEKNERYKNAVLSALDALGGKDLVFEINTGAMARGHRKTPYPSAFILAELRRRGERIMISSDCHDAAFLDFGFDIARAEALKAGFRERVILRNGSFTETAL